MAPAIVDKCAPLTHYRILRLVSIRADVPLSRSGALKPLGMMEIAVNPRCVTVSTEGIHLTLGERDFGVQKNLQT